MKKMMITFFAFLVFLLVTLIPGARADYYGSRTSNKYHYKTCAYFPLIKTSRLLVFATPEDAATAGYIPCPVCGPPSPAAARKPAKPVEPAAPAPASADVKPQDASARINEIKFGKAVDGTERVVIYLDQYYLPEVQVLEGEKPTVNIYFRNGSLASDKTLDLETEGNFVRRIRVQKNDSASRLTVILEMAPGNTFFVNPFFYEQENIYLLEITKLKNASSR